MVVATLARAKLGARLIRGFIDDASDQVESLKSPGMKKCCSRSGVEVAEFAANPWGIGGTITLDALVKTVDAIECADLVDSRLALERVDGSLFSGVSQVLFRSFRMQNHHTRNVPTTIAMTPPITPPIIAPIGVEL